MWFASLKPEDVDGAVKLAVAIIGGTASVVVAIGAAIAAIRAVIKGEKKPAPSAIEQQVRDEVVQGIPISIEQMELEDTIRTRKRLERAIALLAKHGIEYEDYIDGKESAHD